MFYASYPFYSKFGRYPFCIREKYACLRLVCHIGKELFMLLHNFFTPASPVYLQITYINEEFCTLFVKCFQCVKNLFQCCCDHYVTTVSKLKQMKTDWHESIFYPYPWLLVSLLLLPIVLNKKRYLHNAS